MNRSIKMSGWVTVLLGVVLIAVAMIAVTVTDAEARGVQVEPAVVHEGRNPVLYAEHVHRRWFYVELADASVWLMTPCRHDEVTGDPSQTCWWNGNTMGNGEGYSFAVTEGTKHRTVRGAIVVCAGGRSC